MIKALLLDLDGTLLDNDIDSFLQAYLKSLGPPHGALGAARSVCAPAPPVDRRHAGQSPAHAYASARHSPTTSILPSERPRGRCSHSFEAFYRDEFPKLQSQTHRREAAARLVRSALDAGVMVAVATNPLFPRMAIDHRLEWAGVPVPPTRFSLVTSYEMFHSAKPQPAYYAEILGHLGVHAAEAAMVGDSMQDDLEPARSLGMATFHVSPEAKPGDSAGSLEDAIAWFPHASQWTDPEAAKRPSSVLARLHGQLGVLLTLLGDLAPEVWSRRPAPGAWCLTEIICHLRDMDHEVHTPRLDLVLSTEFPFLPAIDINPWAEERNYAAQSGPEALAVLAERRVRLLQRLESPGPAVLGAAGSSRAAGPNDVGRSGLDRRGPRAPSPGGHPPAGEPGHPARLIHR